MRDFIIDIRSTEKIDEMLNKLPPTALYNVLNYLSFKDRAKLKLTCHFLRNFIDDDYNGTIEARFNFFKFWQPKVLNVLTEERRADTRRYLKQIPKKMLSLDIRCNNDSEYDVLRLFGILCACFDMAFLYVSPLSWVTILICASTTPVFLFLILMTYLQVNDEFPASPCDLEQEKMQLLMRRYPDIFSLYNPNGSPNQAQKEDFLNGIHIFTEWSNIFLLEFLEEYPHWRIETFTKHLELELNKFQFVYRPNSDFRSTLSQDKTFEIFLYSHESQNIVMYVFMHLAKFGIGISINETPINELNCLSQLSEVTQLDIKTYPGAIKAIVENFKKPLLNAVKVMDSECLKLTKHSLFSNGAHVQKMIAYGEQEIADGKQEITDDTPGLRHRVHHI